MDSGVFVVADAEEFTMVTLFASLAADVESAFVWLFGIVHAAVSALVAFPGVVAGLF